MTALDRLAAACDIEPFYWDIEGVRHETSPETARAILAVMGWAADDDVAAARSLAELEAARRERLLPSVLVARCGEAAAIRLPSGSRADWAIVEEAGGRREGVASGTLRLPADLAAGYHRLEITCGGREAAMPLIVAPRRCHLPEGFAKDERPWGLMAHLYTLRGERNWGIGDFGDLARLAAWSAECGATAIGINPLHAVSPLRPGATSPYFPSSRLFFNPAYLDLPALPEFAHSPSARHLAEDDAVQAALADMRRTELTDHAGAAALKYRVLEALYDDFRARRDTAEEATFSTFRGAGGTALQRFATYEALAEQFGTPVWRDWPSAYRDPTSAAVGHFAGQAADRVCFRAYVQWLCARQLAETRAQTKACGLSLGLYGDMALGIDPMGADAWADQAVYSGGAELGAPPDGFSPGGQAWGVAVPLPRPLCRAGYAPFVAALRANMAHADVLRIDHVMALQRAFWVPRGLGAVKGAYVRYPLDDLLGILALESRRAGTVVIGEDLGTVDPALRKRLAEADVLSYRVVYFEKDDGSFRPPRDYPRRAVACVGTHDLPPLAGFWQGRDLAARRRLGLYADEAIARRAERQRCDDRAGLLQALAAAGLGEVDPDDDVALRRAVHSFLARSNAWLAMVQIDDLLGETEAINLPGTVDQHANWRRKLRLAVAAIVQDPELRDELHAFAAERAAGAD